MQYLRKSNVSKYQYGDARLLQDTFDIKAKYSRLWGMHVTRVTHFYIFGFLQKAKNIITI